MVSSLCLCSQTLNLHYPMASGKPIFGSAGDYTWNWNWIPTGSKKASGVRIDPQCKKDYDDMHQRKAYSYLVFRISDDDTTIIVDKKGAKGAPYAEFVDEIGKAVAGGKECRYGCVDVEFTVQRQGTDAASHIQKVIFVQCCPDDAPVRKRMLYASSVRGLKSSLGLESLMQVQASDVSDLDEKAIKHELMSQQRI